MPVRPVRLSTCLLLLSVLAARLAAQGATLQGTVSDSAGATLPNASISLEGTGLRTTTGANGGYEIRGVPPGEWTVAGWCSTEEEPTWRATAVVPSGGSADLVLAPDRPSR